MNKHMDKCKKIFSGLLSVILCAAAFSVTSMASQGDHIVINQIYGGGGKGSTPFSHSFIELYNPTDQTIDLNGYSISYSSNRVNDSGKHSGSTWKPDGEAEVMTLELDGSIKAGHSYLIRCSEEETDSPVVLLTQFDKDWAQVIDNETSVEIILYNGDTPIDAVSTRSTDFRDVGEGDSPAVEDISKQKSIRRTNFTDTDQNSSDFSLIVWNDLPSEQSDRDAFISTYRPRSSYDGQWTESLTPPDKEEGPAAPEVKNYGFENGSGIDINKIGSYISGYSNKDGGVAEIVSYDSKTNRAWVVNGTTGNLDILDMSNITCGISDEMTAISIDIRLLIAEADKTFTYGDMTSVAVNSELGIAAVALQEAEYSKDGRIALLDTSGNLIALLKSGVQPDMLTFTPDGSKILVANEGEPRKGYGESITDPAGSVTVITLNTNNISLSESVNIGFESFDNKRDQLLGSGVIMKKGALPSADLEPEYIACDNETAYITLQEANAIAVLDLNTNDYTGIFSLGYKDLSKKENAIDLLEDNIYSPKTYLNAVGAYMPDSVSLYSVNGKTYLLTANEGDAREWGSNETEYINEIKADITASDGSIANKVRVIDPEGTDGLPLGKFVLFGGRSFSIYQVATDGLTQIFDSGNDFEEKTAEYFPGFFNCSNDDNDYDSRSSKKGPEPESITVGQVDEKVYAFIALERIGGIMVYDITSPDDIIYSNYINTRDFSEDPDNADLEKNPDYSLKSDIAPEGLYFISAEQSPSSTPILLAAYEVSGTVAAFSVGRDPSLHNLAHIPAKAPTTESEGNKEYWICASCKKLFSDKNGEFETTLSQIILEKLPTVDDSNEQEEVPDNVDKENIPDTGNISYTLFQYAILFLSPVAIISLALIKRRTHL